MAPSAAHALPGNPQPASRGSHSGDEFVNQVHGLYISGARRDTIPLPLRMDTSQSKNRLLLVDGDPKSLRVLDVSLKKAGFDVNTATSGRDALIALEATTADLIISDTDLAEMDGFDLCSQIKARPEWAKIPFIFVSGRKSIEDKIRGLELGVDDYLTKPIYIKEIGIRVRTALQRAERERMESRREGRTRFAGDLSDVGVVDLVQTIELNRKSGIIHIVNRDNRRGSIFFRDGKVIDAEVGRLSGAHALYRLFSWSDGQFAVEFKQIRRHDVIDVPMAALLMEGMRRLDESTHLLETFSSSTSVLEVDCRVLAEELAELPDEMNSVLRLCDGARTLQEVVEDCDQPDLEALTIINKLYKQQIIFAREAPDPSSESEPGERLARWLSEGDSEDGVAAEDSSSSSEFAAPLEFAQDEDIVPARTPVPTTEDTPAGDKEGQDTGDREIPPKDEKVHDLFPAATQVRPPEVPTAPLENVLSGEETLKAALPPQPDVLTEGSNELARPKDTLSGVPVENLFGEQDEDAKLESAREPVKDAVTRTVTAEWSVAPEQRTTKPLGVAERLLSDDSALRASAMHEAIAEQEARVEESAQTDRTTREYGNPVTAAGLVHEIVSSAHESRPESPAVSHPERPSQEVDWGAWATPQARESSNQDPSDEKGDKAEAPPTPKPPADSSLAANDVRDSQVNQSTGLRLVSSALEGGDGISPSGTAEPAPPILPEPHGSEVQTIARATLQDLSADTATAKGKEERKEAEKETQKKTDESLAKEAKRFTGSAENAPPARANAEIVPAPSAGKAGGNRTGTAKRSTSSRQVWLVALGVVSLGITGLLTFGDWGIPGSDVPRNDSVPSPTLSKSTAPPMLQPVVLPAPHETTTKTDVLKAAVVDKTETRTGRVEMQAKDVGHRGDAARHAAAELRGKCLEVDADGKGKAKAVAAACRSAQIANPDAADLMVILARAELDRGHLAEARNLAKKAIATDPQRFDAYVLLGNAEQEAHRIDEARTAYKKYLDLAPSGPFARELRAILTNL